MDEVDLNFENYEELFGMALTHSESLFENGGFDSLFGEKDVSPGDSNCQDGIAAEVLNSSYPLLVIILAFLLLEHDMLICSICLFKKNAPYAASMIFLYIQLCAFVLLNILTI